MGLGLTETLCGFCKHRHMATHPPTCDAFPHRIPLDIRQMRTDHRQRYAGDYGITFEPMDDSEEARAKLSRIHVRANNSRQGAALARRVRAVYRQIPFTDRRQRWRFGRCVLAAKSFDELPTWCWEAILAAEGEHGRPEEAANPGTPALP
jgi:hypothetical protein